MTEDEMIEWSKRETRKATMCLVGLVLWVIGTCVYFWLSR